AALDGEGKPRLARPTDFTADGARRGEARAAVVRKKSETELGEIVGTVAVEVVRRPLAQVAEMGFLPGVLHAVAVGVAFGAEKELSGGPGDRADPHLVDGAGEGVGGA